MPFEREERDGILGLNEFYQIIEEDNVDDTLEVYESASDEEEKEMRGVEEFEKVLDEMVDDFEEEDLDYKRQ